MKTANKLNMKTIAQLATMTTLAAMLAACGGGGGGGSTPTPPTTPSGPSDADLAIQTSVPNPSYAVGSVELDSLNYLNTRRAACGFGLLAQNTSLDKAAAAHGNYILERYKAGQLSQYLGAPHTEVNGLSGYTGASISDRQKVAGYTSSATAGYGGEVVSMGGSDSTTGFIRALLAGPYHLIAAMGSYRDAGVKLTEHLTPNQSGYYSTFVVEMGYQSHPQRANSVRTYPCDGVSDVPTALGAEYPDPLVAHGLDMTKAGPGLLVAGPFGKKLRVVAATVKPATGGTEFSLGVNMIALSQDNDTYIRSWGDAKMNEAVLVPHFKLAAMTRYDVNITVDVAGVQSVKTFSFTTGN